VTATREKDTSHLIMDVETISTLVSDDARTALLHKGLKQRPGKPGDNKKQC
jgi:hypothetical protein